ncbi:MAG: GTP-binding protein, partial [Eubacterium sp.]
MKTPPKLILFSGFLGSGKTTLLNLTARYLTDKGLKIAMIINEAGEVGVDNLYLKQKGYAVRELFGGCICCTMAENLNHLIQELTAAYDIDVILMEPSGTADPKALYKPITRAGFSPESIHHITLLDPLRAQMFMDILEPLLASALPLAQCAVINKIDLATPEMLTFSEATLQQHNKEIPILQMDLTTELTPEYQH